jgi:hypothetical protein
MRPHQPLGAPTRAHKVSCKSLKVDQVLTPSLQLSLVPTERNRGQMSKCRLVLSLFLIYL